MPLNSINPNISELLPTPELRVAYEKVIAADRQRRCANLAASKEAASKATTPVLRSE